MWSYQAVYCEVDVIAVLFVGMLFYRIKNFKSFHMYPYYIGIMISTMVLACSDLFVQLLLGGSIPYNREALMLLKFAYFLSIAVMAFCWFMYYEAKTCPENLYRRKFRVLAALPLGTQIALEFLNLLFHFFYSGSEDGSYIRGSLFVLQYIVPCLYIVIGLFRALYRVRFKTRYIDVHYMCMLGMIPLWSFGAGVAELFYPEIPMSAIADTIVVLIIFFDESDNLISNDTLTDLYNRRYFIQYLSRRLVNGDKDKGNYLMMMDIDYFKRINDVYGHVEGDNALIRLAHALTRATNKLSEKPVLARYGGDEFIGAFQLESGMEFDLYLSEVRKILAEEEEKLHTKYHICISAGIVPYDSSYQYVNDYINAADRALYVIKKSRRRLQ